MRREKYLFDRVTAFANLHRAFAAASRGKRDQTEVRAFEYRLENELWCLRRELESGRYVWGPFRSFVIPDTYACLTGRGTHRAVSRYRELARRRGGQGYVLKCDVRSYFASVDHEVLGGLLARRIGDRDVLELLASLIAHGADGRGCGIPIGNLTSQMFANAYLDPLDHFVKETLRVTHYIRYMDDFVLMLDSRADARARLDDVAGFLSERLRLNLNPARVTIAPVSAKLDFLGYVHRPGGATRVRRRNVRKLWTRLAWLDHGVARGDDALGKRTRVCGELVRRRSACRCISTVARDLFGARRS